MSKFLTSTWTVCVTFVILLIIKLMDPTPIQSAKLTTFDSYQNFGKHLDSITDVITSGVVPGVVGFQLFKLSGNKVSDFEVLIFGYDLTFSLSPISFIAFLITIGSAIRLSKFNTSIGYDEFIGLPPPANAIFFSALPVLINSELFVESKEIFLNNYFLITSIVFSLFLM